MVTEVNAVEVGFESRVPGDPLQWAKLPCGREWGILGQKHETESSVLGFATSLVCDLGQSIRLL